MAIPVQNIAVFLQKFTVTAPTATAFSALYNSVGVFTTNVPKSRQWQFTFNGNFTSLERFEIIYDFSKVDTFGYSIKFEGDLNGFITCDKQIYACDRYLKYIPQTEEDIKNEIVRLLFKPPCPGQELVNRSLYYVVNLNDSACYKQCYSNSSTPILTSGTTIDFKTISSGSSSYSTYSYSYFFTTTTICAHKETVNGKTVVFLYFSSIDNTSYWSFVNFSGDNIVVQFANLTDTTDGEFIFYLDDSSCTAISAEFNDIGTTSYPYLDQQDCFTTSTTTYMDPYPITKC